MHKLSIIIITKNEERKIGDAVRSAAFADEVLVVDSGSTDQTCEIAIEAGARLEYQAWLGFGLQKQCAVELAAHDWVFILDADERITPSLQTAITKTLENPRFDGYLIARLNRFFGRFVKSCGLYPDYTLRLFDRKKGRFNQAKVHESVIIDGTISKLDHYMIHLAYDSVDEFITKQNAYSQLHSKRPNLLKALTRPLWTFINLYILKRGFMEGLHGYVIARLYAQYTFWKYIKHVPILQNTNDLISIIITTYNRADALKLSLDSLSRQTDLNFEVIIADDGSDAAHQAEIRRSINSSHLFPVRYIYQTDQGFRAARIRNKAVAQSKGSYLIFVDGDCLMLPNFIEYHRRLSEKGYFVPGNRILLSSHYSHKVLQTSSPVYLYSKLSFLRLFLKRNINHFGSLLQIPLGVLRKWNQRQWTAAKTCNLAIWQQDFLAINGFDESFEGWGYEDSDLVIRLIKTGIRRKSGRYVVPVLHLWHPPHDRYQEFKNRIKLENSLKKDGRIVIDKGVNQHLINQPKTEALSMP
jgi:glycosyltransferase involved in cell wall biosynthesis